MELLTAANVRVPSLGTLLKLLPTVIIRNNKSDSFIETVWKFGKKNSIVESKK